VKRWPEIAFEASGADTTHSSAVLIVDTECELVSRGECAASSRLNRFRLNRTSDALGGALDFVQFVFDREVAHSDAERNREDQDRDCRDADDRDEDAPPHGSSR
jgi:hypothetical protein